MSIVTVLLPCPFCGYTEVVHRWADNVAIRHKETCLIYHVTTLRGADEIAAWNRRVDVPAPEPVHAPDCAVAVSARHECSCGVAEFRMPVVCGRRSSMSNADFERACLVHIEQLQHGMGPYDSAMLATFCEAVRMVREYSDAMQGQAPTDRKWPVPGAPVPASMDEGDLAARLNTEVER